MKSMKQEDFLLVVRELSKTFEGKKKAAVHPQNLQVQEGEVVALVGGSGSGKTTLLRMIAGLEEPDTGNVLFKGERVSGPSDQLIAGHPSIRLVHQHFELAHRLSVYDNITQKLRHLPREDQKEQTIELLEVCYLSHLSSQKVEALSGGEKQRLALARTLAEMPELLLLDEPFSNLDPILKEEIKRNLLTYIRRRGIATILVSHDPIDALSLADTIWVLENGSLMQEGRPKEVYFKPATPSVAALFGKLLVVVKEKLVTVLQEPARSYVQALPGELVGIRPEVWQQANGEDAHLQAEVLEVAFQGAASEAYVQLGSLSFSVYLPPFSTVNTSELLPLRLRLEFVQCW